MITARGCLDAEGGEEGAIALDDLFGVLGSHGVGNGSELEPWVHFSVPGDRSAGCRTTNVHGEIELLVPRDSAWEASDRTKVDADVAVGYPDTAVIGTKRARTLAGAGVVAAGFCPEAGTAGSGVVELELDVVVAVWGNGTSAAFQAGLEVQVVAG